MKGFEEDFNYTLVVNEKDGGDQFETYGEDLEKVREANPDCVWTVVENDYGDLILIHGFHLVDRLFYLITKEPVREEDRNTEYLYA